MGSDRKGDHVDSFPTSAPTRIDLGGGSETIADRAPAALLPRLTEGELVAGRYRITGMLGRGGFGEVYRVADARESTRVLALKLHRVAGRNRLALEALKGEFALLASLRHPNLAPVHDFGYVGDDVAFFTQSIVDGVPLDRADLTLSSAEDLGLLAQLCRALDYLHARGILHRDVKPSNVLVDRPSGRLTLLDFGISRAFGESDELDLAGTHAFMSPEAISGAQLDARSDLYSLGVTLYLLVAGKTPFTGPAEHVLRGHVFEAPPPLTGVPVQLASVIHRLLEKQPGDRYATGAEVIDALSAAAGVAVANESMATLTSYVLSGRFVGNDAILQRLRGWVTLLGSGGRPQPIVLVGDAGTGKSRLTRELQQHAQLDGASFVAARTRRGDDGKALLAEVARAVLTEDVVRLLTDDDRMELARSVPSLRRRGERLAMPLDPERARVERLRALGVAVALRFAWRPGVLLIEDAHFAATDVVAAVESLHQAARAADAAMLLLVTARPGEVANGLCRAVAAERVHVPELDPAASAALVASMFGDDDIVANTELGHALATRSHPALHVQELLRLAVESGAIARVGGRWRIVAPLRAQPLHDVLAARVANLHRRTRELGVACAVLAHPATTGEIAKVAGRSLDRAAPTLAELVGAGVVEDLRDERGRPLHAMHDRFVDVVLATASRKALVSGHVRAAKMLSERGEGDPHLLARAAEHLATAGQLEDAHAMFERAARDADRAGRPDAALALLERAARAAPSARADSVEVQVLTYDVAVKSGLGAKADATLRLLTKRRRHVPLAEQVAIDVRRARAALRRGAPSSATGIARRALETARALGDANLELDTLLASGDIEFAVGRIEPALARFLEARALAKRRRNRAGLARASLGAALAALHLGQLPVAEGHALEAARQAEQRADPEMRSDAFRHLGNVARERGDLRRAAASYRRAVRAAREGGSVDREAKALNNLGTVAQWTGQVAEAMLAFERAIALKERAGTEASALLTYNNLGALLLAVGRLDDAERVLDRCLSGSSSPILAEVARANAGDLSSLRGRFDHAIDSYRQSLAFCRKQAFTSQQSHVLSGLIRTLLMQGGPAMAEVESLVGELETLTGSGVAEAERRFHTARAAWLDVTGQTKEAYAAAERAVHAADRRTLFSDVFGTHLDAAWLRTLLLARLGRRRAAERALGSCRKTLAQLAAKVGELDAQRTFVLGHPVHRAIDRGDLSLPPGFTFRVDASPQAS